MGMASRTIRDRMAQRPAFQSALAAAADGEFIPVPGGVLILDPAGTAVLHSGSANRVLEVVAARLRGQQALAPGIVAVRIMGSASSPARAPASPSQNRARQNNEYRMQCVMGPP
jgi:hypothetical protein